MIKRSFTIPREQCCCEEMFNAVSSKNKVPINAREIKPDNKPAFYRFGMPFVDAYNPEELKLLGEILEEVAEDSIAYCPFCGKYISPCDIDISREWEKRKHLCVDFLDWFVKKEDGKYFTAPTPMFKFEPKENKFYMHYRKRFGEGWIPIKYCIYCGEPLSEMIEKHGLPKFIADQLDPSEWEGKYKLWEGKYKLSKAQQKLREYLNWPNFYT